MIYAFDLFGTLIQSVRHPRPFRRLYDCGRPRAEVRRILLCSNLDVPDLLQELGLSPALAYEQEASLAQAIKALEVYPDTIEVLERLHSRGHRMAIISNLAKPFVAPAMRLLPDVFEATVFSCEVGLAKPDKAIFEILAKRLNVPPGQITMVGDSLRSDIEGARAAGMKALHLDRAGGAEALASLLDMI